MEEEGEVAEAWGASLGGSDVGEPLLSLDMINPQAAMEGASGKLRKNDGGNGWGDVWSWKGCN